MKSQHSIIYLGQVLGNTDHTINAQYNNKKPYLPAYIYIFYTYTYGMYFQQKKLKHDFHVTYVTTLELSPDIGNNPSVGFLQISPLMLHPDSYRDDTWGPKAGNVTSLHVVEEFEQKYHWINTWVVNQLY